MDTDIHELLQYIFTILLGILIGYIIARTQQNNIINNTNTLLNNNTLQSSLIPQRVDFTGGLDKSLNNNDSNDNSQIEQQQDESLQNQINLINNNLKQRNSNERRRVIIVAKQLPIQLTRSPDGQWSMIWDDPRSFLSNMRVLRDSMEVIWLGWPGCYVPKSEQDTVEELLELHGCVPVFLSNELADRFFNGFCRGVLWPLFHYTLPTTVIDFAQSFDDSWQAYTAANTLYATQISHTVESSHDLIWVHNYHLLLVPGFVRNKLPRAKIGLFLHTPFCSSDVFRLLPTRTNMLTAIMAADLIGFHTFDYARHFLSSIKRVMDLDFETLPGGRLGIKYSGRFVSIIINHVGVDANFFRQQIKQEEVINISKQIKNKYNNKQIIISVDDLDMVKGSLLKIQAYDRFLDRYHDTLRNNVVLIQIIGKSGSSEQEQKVVYNALQRVFDTIHNKHGNHVLEVLHKEAVDLSTLCAYYTSSDCSIVSTFWDGLNLVPFEYTASQSTSSPGSLIVSEFMGCSRSLNGVLRVNPWNLDNVVDALYHSLTMSLDERKANHSRRFQYVMNHNVERWSLQFLDSLELASKQGASLSYVQVGWGSNVRLLGVRSDFQHLDENHIAVCYRKCNKRILLLDYDGTLNSPEKSAQRSKLVTPSNTVMNILRMLTQDNDNYVFIMSGRTRDCLHEWFKDLPELGIAAEKGCFLKWPNRLQKLNKSHVKHRSSDKLSSIIEDDKILHNVSHSHKAHRNDEKSMNNDYISDNDSLDSDDDDYASDSDFDATQWQSLVPLDDITWKSVALDLIKSYTESVDGSWIEDKEFAIVWHYEQADPEYGRMQASELHKYLIKVINNPSVDIAKYDYNRILEVKPKGINKGVAASVIMATLINHTQYDNNSNSSVNTPSNRSTGKSPILTGVDAGTPSSPSFTMVSPTLSPKAGVYEINEPFILAIGDDRSDEEMFAAVHNRDSYNRNKPHDVAAQALRRHKHHHHTSSHSKQHTATSSDNNNNNNNNNDSNNHSNYSNTTPSSQHHVHFASQDPSSPQSNASDSSQQHLATITLREEQVETHGRSPNNSSVNNNTQQQSQSQSRSTTPQQQPRNMMLRASSEPLQQPNLERHGSTGSISSNNADELQATNKKPSHPYTFTVCVGMKPSKAHYYLHDDEEVIRMLAALASCSQRAIQSKQNDITRTSYDTLQNDKNPNSLPTLTLPSLSMFKQNRTFSLTNMKSAITTGSNRNLSSLGGHDSDPDSPL